MATPQHIREWLLKMEYLDPNPSEKALETFSRGAVGLLFQQLVEKIKPRQEVTLAKKELIVQKLHQSKIKSRSDQIIDDDLKEIKLNNEKIRLEKNAQELIERNDKNETNLQMLRTKIKTKDAKIQLMKPKKHENELNTTLIKAKRAQLHQQIAKCKSLYKLSQITERPNITENSEKVNQKINDVLNKLRDEIHEFDFKVENQISDHPPNFLHVTHHISTSFLLSSRTKPLSTIKKRSKTPKATSTRLNLFNNDNNLNDTNPEIKVIFEKLCCNNESLRKFISEEIWKFNCGTVLKILIDLKMKNNKNLIELITSKHNRNMEINKKETGMEKLYTVHIEYEMKRFQSKENLRKISDLLNGHYKDVNENIFLQATENALYSLIKDLQNQLLKYRQQFPDNTEKLNRSIAERKKLQSEIITLQAKVESLSNILSRCNNFLLEQKNNVSKKIKASKNYYEFQLLESYSSENSVQEFLSFHPQLTKSNYIDSWHKIYENPELLQIIDKPYLTPENALKAYYNERIWKEKLTLMQQKISNEKTERHEILTKLINKEQLNKNLNCDKLLESLENSQKSLEIILKNNYEVNKEINLWKECTLNKVVFPKLLFKGKDLQYYVEKYEKVYQLLEK